MTQADQLKPCPWCGEATEGYHVERCVVGGYNGQVFCEKCLIYGPLVATCGDRDDLMRKAADAWNRRADLPCPSAEVVPDAKLLELMPTIDRIDELLTKYHATDGDSLTLLNHRALGDAMNMMIGAWDQIAAQLRAYAASKGRV